jgi:hypothetical protein
VLSVNEIGIGKSLGIGTVNSPSCLQPAAQLTGHFHRADSHAIPASGAQLGIYVPGLAGDGDTVMAWLPFKAFDLGVWHKLNIGMAVALDERTVSGLGGA